ncbi:MBL fold metallo-hydrolase [Liquorilactobacillus satsumensis]|uniref:MBL fold metallo-hydrolase n=1 Tax=Liquorilactobacillus satsumensis TaxID=259059 RepID=UPI0021C46C4E|nr:MBL fold metallo-hydrolase [Liquorilactobacillus satsumensis]MCP9328849.1 hypothetical protein [Liquorilactobacillus satsumensis]
MTTTVKFLNGLRTIGGNIVEICTENARVITDFGLVANTSIADPDEMLAKHILPDIPELFGKKAHRKYQAEAIFITHLHLDHTAALAYLRSDIPVYVSRQTYHLYRSLAAQGMALALNINFQVFDYEEPVRVGDLTVTGYQSDHDVYGAAALLISDGRHFFGNSGDVRLNGPHRSHVDHWMHIFRQLKLDLFMLEGTSFTTNPVEQGVTNTGEQCCLEKFKTALRNSSELIVISPYLRNIERLFELNQAALVMQRPIVWEAAYAEVLRDFYSDIPIYVLADNKGGGRIAEGLIPVTPTVVNHNKRYFCVQNSFERLQFLARFSNFTYLHCNSDPLGIYDPHYHTLTAFLTHHQAALLDIGVSGHATQQEICKIAQVVHAKQTAMWHSFHPERAVEALKQTELNPLLPEYSKEYRFE